jgi:hypothetical protein
MFVENAMKSDANSASIICALSTQSSKGSFAAPKTLTRQ